MSKNRSHGTPEQLEDLVRNRIDELSGGVESATAINADTDIGPWKFLGSKNVVDFDGFYTDYTLWFNNETGMYVCIFGDRDLYNPENSEPDYATDSEFDAYEWFENYDTGELDGEDDIYDEIHSSINRSNQPIVAKDNGMENSGYVALILDIIPDFLKGNGIADDVTKVAQDGEDIVFTLTKDGATYTARFPEYELTGSDHDDLPDDEWLIEDAARDAIAGINAATNTCGIGVKPVVSADELYIDDSGMLGEPGARYSYHELKQIYDEGKEYDPVIREYSTFDDWFNDTSEYLWKVNASSKIDADLSEIPDVTEVVIEGADNSGYSMPFNSIKDVVKMLNSWGIDTTKHRYELEAEEYERYGSGSQYRYRFTAPGDWVAYFAMQLHRDMSPDAVVEYLNDYFDDEDELAEINSIPAIRDTAAMSWWGDGDDFIHYLKNLDTGEILYQADDSMYEEYDDDDYDVE